EKVGETESSPVPGLFMSSAKWNVYMPGCVAVRNVSFESTAAAVAEKAALTAAVVVGLDSGVHAVVGPVDAPVVCRLYSSAAALVSRSVPTLCATVTPPALVIEARLLSAVCT